MSSEAHNQDGAKKEREIEEDIMNVPVIAWLGVVGSILIAVSVILLIGVYYLTQGQQNKLRQEQADERITELEAYRIIDAEVVNGHFRHPDVDDGQGNVTRGKVSIPIQVGMRQIADKY